MNRKRSLEANLTRHPPPGLSRGSKPGPSDMGVSRLIAVCICFHEECPLGHQDLDSCRTCC
eukprot:15456040-Alexandrium_andersonii.AAC.1